MKIENAKNIVASFSGGRSSAVMVSEMIKRGYPPIAVVFCNTGMETDETYDFVCGVDDNILKPANVPFHIVEFDIKNGYRVVDKNSMDREGKPLKDMARKYLLPSYKFRICTSFMKVEAKGRFLRDHYRLGNTTDIAGKRKVEEYTSACGIRADEPKRISAQTKQNYNYEAKLNGHGRIKPGDSWIICPLDEWRFTKQHVVNEIKLWGKWADVAKGSAHLSNCIGCFNVKGGITSQVSVWKKHPKHARIWLELEENQKKTKNAFPVKPMATHRKVFNKDLPFDLRDKFNTNHFCFWKQSKMLHERGDEVGTLGLEFDSGGCDGAFCGTD